LVPGEIYYPLREKMPASELLKPLPSFLMRGAIRSEEPMPLPGDTSSLKQFDLDGIDVNQLGTVRAFPKRSIIEGTVRWKDSGYPESEPWPEEDLEIGKMEQEAVQKVVSDLGLRDLPTTAAKVARIAAWFASEFQYTQYLTISQARFAKPSAVSAFLTTSKRGHCEYFATAATLMLRAADVPARYCVGYAVMERDVKRDEYVIRGVHGHAWTRVWDEEKATWTDFDPTPPDWLAAETRGSTKSLWLADTYQRFKEDFFLWRNRPANRIGATIVMWVLGLGVFTFVARRLWKSRLVVGKDPYGGLASPGLMTPLHQLEKRATKVLGPRPVGVTFAEWLRGLGGHCVPEGELDEALDLHQQMRFDPAPPPSGNESRLDALASGIAAKIKRAAPAAKRPN
jgi:hypothetical protein